jgi:hypothetical protein
MVPLLGGAVVKSVSYELITPLPWTVLMTTWGTLGWHAAVKLNLLGVQSMPLTAPVGKKIKTVPDRTFAAKLKTDLSRMEPIHPCHRYKDQSRVKHVIIEFLGHQLAVETLDILDRSENTSNEDQGGSDVENRQVALPSDRGLF